ncbi:MAG TPA: beta-N-acetylhexosaminidase [Labilithrix sp.]
MPGSVHDALCGQLLVVGLGGVALEDAERRALASRSRAGVVLFKRNIEPGLANVTSLIAAVRDATPSDAPPLVAVDQEGGRVVRLGPPALALPAMRRLGDLDDEDLLRRLASAQARELRALGFTMSFAPIADVHTRATNPIIGDRAFATTPERVARLAGAWADGLARGGLLSCAKHFPGHGDTTVDSHLALPRVERAREELDRIEIAPFAALAKRVDAMMTAHVVYDALDPARPATLSRAVCTDLVRGALGFEGVLVSDDLEMQAISHGTGEAAVLAVSAGCDMLLVCSRPDLAEEAHAALVREAESSPAFRARCEEAAARGLAMRRRVPPAPVASLAGVFDDGAKLAAELATRLEAGR